MITNRSLKITILMDNQAKPGFLSEHGFSVWIESDGQKILFDSGSSDALTHNAAKMGIDLSEADQLVLSHGHYDHTGYVAELLHINPQLKVVMHPATTRQRFSIHPNVGPRDISMSLEARSALDAHATACKTITEKSCELGNGVGSSGSIPRNNVSETTGGPFFLDPKGQFPDWIEDDQSLWVNTSHGLVIITGCCHAGLMNTVEHIQSVTGETKIYAIIGGLHLKHALKQRVQETVAALKKWNPTFLVPCHCTGDAVIKILQQEFGKSVKPGYAGLQLSINHQLTVIPCPYWNIAEYGSPLN